jgi:hypothetical protein
MKYIKYVFAIDFFTSLVYYITIQLIRRLASMAHGHATEPTNERRGRILVPALIAALSVAALAGCAPDNAGAKPTTPPTATSSETPAPSATPEQSELLEAMYGEEAAVFINRPIDERLELCDAEAEKVTLEDIGDAYYSVSGNDIDKMPANVSIDSTPQEIISSIANLIRLAAVQQDTNLAAKIASCAYVNPASNPGYIHLTTEVLTEENTGYPVQSYAQDGVLKTPEVVDSSTPVDGVDEDGNPTRIIVITTTVSKGPYTYVGGGHWAVAENQ